MLSVCRLRHIHFSISGLVDCLVRDVFQESGRLLWQASGHAYYNFFLFSQAVSLIASGVSCTLINLVLSPSLLLFATGLR